LISNGVLCMRCSRRLANTADLCFLVVPNELDLFFYAHLTLAVRRGTKGWLELK